MSTDDADRERYGGMTLNERLYVSGLAGEFDAAVRRGDREAVISILTKVALSDSDAAWSADTVLANPKRYGF
jgi:hypothetical protein